MINCYHWLMCLSLFFSLSPDEVYKSYPANESSVIEEYVQPWKEYDSGYIELCPAFKIGQPRSENCSQRARQRLREWLDKQAENCLKTSIPGNSSLTTRSCRPGADAVFSYVVAYRESE